MARACDLPGFDPYSVLGVSPEADEHEIRRAYRRLVARCHPDLNPEQRARLEPRLLRLNLAVAVLLDPERRAAYDRQRSTASRPVRPRSSGFGPGAARTDEVWQWVRPQPAPGVAEAGLDEMARSFRSSAARLLLKISIGLAGCSPRAHIGVLLASAAFACLLIGTARPRSLSWLWKSPEVSRAATAGAVTGAGRW